MAAMTEAPHPVPMTQSEDLVEVERFWQKVDWARQPRGRGYSPEFLANLERNFSTGAIVEYLQARLRHGKAIGNPLYELWRIGQELMEISGGMASLFNARRVLCRAFSWAVPDKCAIEAIAEYSPNGVIEVGAGSGYWARMLHEHGVDVKATDLHPAGCPCREEHPFSDGTSWFPVKVGTALTASRFIERTLLLVWPPMSDMAAMAANEFWHRGGERLIYVGEGPGGCTADDIFFARLGEEPWCRRCDWPDSDTSEPHDCPKQVTQRWRRVEAVYIPQWEGIHDALFVYERLQ